MARIDSSSATVSSRGTSPVVKGIAWVGIAVLTAIIAIQGRVLYRSLLMLRADQVKSRGAAIVGYIDIHPQPSFAQTPKNWIHDDGEHTLLWAGWRDDKHVWFRISRGDVLREHVTAPFGIDAIRAIDHPIVEEGGGERWERIPDDALVAGVELGGVHAVYPLKLLEKVEVVNDLIADMPLLVAFRPFSLERESVALYEASLGGQRITMGLSGYFHGPEYDRKPLMYDRGTSSLWVEREGYVVSVAGPHKGAQLHQVGKIEVLPWYDWRSRHPRSRLVVGADRSKPKPGL
jgi:Protein of unknown function (DUF3179)